MMNQTTGELGTIPLTPMASKNQIFELQRILVCVTGGSAAGKTTLCETIKKEMHYDSEFDMTIISLDSFYKGINKEEVDIANYNFDHPDALDWDLAYSIIQSLLQGRPAQVPVYCFVTHKRLDKYVIAMPSQVIVFEGILALCDERIRQLMSYKIFIHCDDDIRLCRRILRDVNERQRSVEGILYQYNRFVKSSFDDYIKPTMSLADIIIPGSRDNHVSVSFIVNHLKNLAKNLGILKQKMLTILYFGDLLYSVDNFMKNKAGQQSDGLLVKESRPYKQFLFPTEESLKGEFLIIVQNFMAQKLTTEKQIYKTLKLCHKQTLTMLERTLASDKISFIKLQALNISEIYNKNKITLPVIESDYVFVTLPFLFRGGQLFLHYLSQHLRQSHPKVKIIVINLFSDIKVITEMYGQYKNIKYVVNAFLVGKMDEFVTCLRLPNTIEDGQPDLNYQASKLYCKMLRFKNKRQK